MLYNELLKKRNINKECPFCRAKDKMFKENEFAYLTYALAPYHPHHLLVIPRRHVGSFLQFSKKETTAIDELLRYGVKLLNSLGYADLSVLVRDGVDNPNKTVEHLHYNLVPKTRIGDLDHKGNLRKVLTSAQIKKTIEDVKKTQKKIK